MSHEVQTDYNLLQSSRAAASIFHKDGLALRRLQANLTSSQRYLLRSDPEILFSLFSLRSIPLPKSIDSYYFWDSTTLSLFEIAQKHITQMHISNPIPRLLDLGCGPYAILGCALKKQYPYIYVKSTDINPSRTRSALAFSSLNNINIDISVSNLLDSCADNFDLILFNPPYVQPASLQHNFLDLTTEELVSGIARESPQKLISRLLDQLLSLQCTPTLLLGINNFFLPHSTMMDLLSAFSVSVSLGYPESAVTPHGNYSQVYSITRCS